MSTDAGTASRGEGHGSISPMMPGLRVLLTNAFGIQNKIGELQHSMLNNNIDIAVVTETKLSDSIPSSLVSVPGYTIIRRDRDAAGGGVGIWARTYLFITQITNIPDEDFELLWISVTLRSQEKIVIGAVYRPGSCSETDTRLIQHLDTHCDAVRSLGTSIIILGDFNVHNRHWLCSTKTTLAGEVMEQFCAAHHLTQHVSQPTRGENTLDLVLSDFTSDVTTAIHPPIGRSDHAVIIAQFNVQAYRREMVTTRTVWRYNDADWGRMRAELKRTDWATVITDDPEASCQNLVNVIVASMNRYIPSKQLRTRPSDPKWWTPECSIATNAKNRAWKCWRHHRHDENLKQEYISAVNRTVEVLAKSKAAMETRLRAKLTSGSLRD